MIPPNTARLEGNKGGKLLRTLQLKKKKSLVMRILTNYVIKSEALMRIKWPRKLTTSLLKSL